MTAHTLPADVARCLGAGSDAEGWREGCDVCLRRLAPPAPGRHTLLIEPPAIVAFWCEHLIEPEVRGHIAPETPDTEGGDE